MPARESKTSTVPVVLATFGIFSARSKWLPVAIGDHGRNLLISLWHGDKQQSMEWRHSGSPSPQKIPSAKIRWKSSLLDFLVSRGPHPHWLSSKGPNYRRGGLFISAGATENILKEKCRGKVTNGGLVLARQCSGSPGTCNPEEAGLTGLPTSWLYTLFSGSGPRLTTICSLDWTKQLKLRHFSSDSEVIAAAETWLDGQRSEFFWVACKN